MDRENHRVMEFEGCDVNLIPPMTHPLSKHWEQPKLDRISIEGDVARMTRKTFNELGEYSYSTPTGVYPGKMWKAERNSVWYLRWYGADDGDPRGLPTPWRKIEIVEKL